MESFTEACDWSAEERERIQAALAEGERVLWSGRPRVRLVHRREVPVVAFFVVLNVALSLSAPSAGPVWAAAVIAFMAAAVLNRWLLRTSCSVLTQHRALSLRRNLWGHYTLLEWNPDKDFPGIADVDENGCGDLVFAEQRHGELVWTDGLHGIPNVRAVAALIGVDDCAPENDK